jgi:hypothetical protein
VASRIFEKVKYPKTLHLPQSPGLQNDDKLQGDLSSIYGEPLVVTEKMDGENTTLYRDGWHARSLTNRKHPSRDWLQAYHAERAYKIPEGIRVCGENLYAVHSVRYETLPCYFLVFGIFMGNSLIDWQTTEALAHNWGFQMVPKLWEGTIKYGWQLNGTHTYSGKSAYGPTQEGYVVRRADSIHIDEYQRKVVKFVRKDHIQTDEHWLDKPVEKNGLTSNWVVLQ